jgi:hypothetical protein
MSPARRLELAFQAYQVALDIVRLTERGRHPDLPPSELAWRVMRRMQGNLRWAGKLYGISERIRVERLTPLKES